MGCLESLEDKNAADQFQRRNEKLQKIDARTLSKLYIQERVNQGNFTQDKQDRTMLHKTIMTHNFLYRLPAHERTLLIQCFDSFTCKANTKIFKKGDNATLFFIVRNGKVQISPDGDTHKQSLILQRGGHFGDLALLYTSSRSADAIALTDCEFFCISNELFRRTVKQITKRNFEFAKKFIGRVLIFKYLTKREKTLITYNSLVLQYHKNEVIFKKNDDANAFFVITSGKVEIQIDGKSTLELTAGQSFGQNCFRENQLRNGTAIAIEKTALLSISRQSLKKCLNSQLEDISYYNILKWALGRDSLFSMASSIQRQKIIASVQILEMKKDQTICFSGEKIKFLIIVLDGETNGQEIGTVFNKEYLKTDNDSQQRLVQNIEQTKSGKVAKIPFEIIYALFGKKMENIINRAATRQAILELSNKRDEYMRNLRLEEFTVKMKIGEGQHGKVHLVQDSLGRRYAMKWMQKSLIIKNQLEKFVINEKRILQIVESPFILKLYRTFQDDHCIYFLLNLINGTDFFDFMRELGLCNKKITQFYSGCFILALQHLHDKSIVHRDLKPENAVIDESGYLHIVDLGIAKELTQESGYRTFTVIGTPHYMAPEIVELEGYSFSSDLWSLGIIMFEMMCGQLPYGNALDDPYEIFKQIFSRELKFPKFITDHSAKNLISKLLSKNPSGRFIEQFSKLKNMQFYKDFDWEQLNTRSMKPPILPNSQVRQVNIEEKLTVFIQKQIQNSELIQSDTIWDQFF